MVCNIDRRSGHCRKGKRPPLKRRVSRVDEVPAGFLFPRTREKCFNLKENFHLKRSASLHAIPVEHFGAFADALPSC